MEGRQMSIPDPEGERIVILGGGFGGLELLKALKGSSYQVVLLDRNNYFTFQPLLYQVATSGLEPNSIAYPFRKLTRGTPNLHFRMQEVVSVDPEKKLVRTRNGELGYDHLVLATGSRPQFFGIPEDKLLSMKTVPDALQIRNYLLTAFESALLADSPEEKEQYLNIVIVGAGPTGVELAGALGEMKRFVLPKDYPDLPIDQMHIHLVEALDQILNGMSVEASESSRRFLEELGVTIHLGSKITEFDGEKVYLGDSHINSTNLIWTAGVKPNVPEGIPGSVLSENGRIRTDVCNRVDGFQNVYVIGDLAHQPQSGFEKGLPMLAPVAMQQGRHLGKNFRRMAAGKKPEAFSYNHRGTMATIGRNRAVVDFEHWKFQGAFAWFLWMAVHLFTLIGFRNRTVVLFNWVYNYFRYDKALRLILRSGRKMPARQRVASDSV